MDLKNRGRLGFSGHYVIELKNCELGDSVALCMDGRVVEISTMKNKNFSLTEIENERLNKFALKMFEKYQY